MQNDSSRLFRDRISREEQMDPLMNGHSPEQAKQIKTQEQVLGELLSMIVDRLPHLGPDIEDLQVELDIRSLLQAFLDMEDKNE